MELEKQRGAPRQQAAVCRDFLRVGVHVLTNCDKCYYRYFYYVNGADV